MSEKHSAQDQPLKANSLPKKILVKKHGEKKVFIGSVTAQATSEYFGWPQLVPVKDLQTAKKAIETMVTEGEGARGDWKNSHFGRFLRILNKYRELKRKDPKFEPSRPVIAAFSRPPADVEANSELIDEKFTADVSDLFNETYKVLLQMLSRFFLHVDTTSEELQTLSRASVQMMIAVIKPLGHLLTTLPVGSHRPGITAGPVFEIYSMSYFLPRARVAWKILSERLTELSSYCYKLGKSQTSLDTLKAIAESLSWLAGEFNPSPASAVADRA